MFRSLLLYLCVFNASLCFAQDSILPVTCSKIAIDNVDNLYTINKNDITKYFINGQVKSFSIKTLGDIYFVDATNALRILVYFKDLQKILFLDSQLSQNGDIIELSDYGLELASLVCSSINNGFWVYNPNNNELVRFNQNLEMNVQTGNLKRILNNNIHPNFMIEHNGKLYLNSPNEGILIFDIYGAYIKTISIKDLNYFQVSEPFIIYRKDNKIQQFNTKLFEEKTLMEVPDNCTEFLIRPDKCIYLFPKKIQLSNCAK